ncbi:hypothetical protein [Halalkalibacter oceani]|uniref:hypothetical protein n=1 Tax=Halalkalibacter oceani TaxID=1653776 RepID=UPI003392ACC2
MKDLKKHKFSVREVIEYIEYKILHNEETDEEYGWYVDYRWFGIINKDRVLRKILDEMHEYWG